MAEGREGDWECDGCRNRNYAFRSFCNRCKQPRILVDTKTPADSKWLPRIGDWICTGCTNNNYASREKCKKCGQPKEIAAMPAIAMPGASGPAYAHYFSRGHDGPEQKMNIGWPGNDAIRQPLPPGSNWPIGLDGYAIHSSSGSNWPLDGRSTSMLPSASHIIHFPEGWRNGDWICPCGFHNYSSRAECKKCNNPMPPAHGGTKRLASEELFNEWDKKRLMAGQLDAPEQHFMGLQQVEGSQRAGLYPSFPPGIMPGQSNMPLNMPFPYLPPPATSTIPGKGARQWRDGDWMCSICSNHNYASRSHCNRCKSGREMPDQPVSVP